MDFLSLFSDSSFWVLIAFVVFIFVAFKYGKEPILGILDSRTDSIRKEIEQAEALRHEAQKLLADYQTRHRDAINEAEQIVARAKEQAAILEKEAKISLDKAIERRKKQAEDKIKLAEEQAVQEIQEQIVELATSAAGDLIKKNMSGKAGDKLIEQSIDDLKQSA